MSYSRNIGTDEAKNLRVVYDNTPGSRYEVTLDDLSVLVDTINDMREEIKELRAELAQKKAGQEK